MADSSPNGDRISGDTAMPKSRSNDRPGLQTTPPPKQEQEEMKPGVMARIKAKLMPKIPIFLLMFKGALAPTIAIAIFQSDAVAAEYTTLGYLVAIMALLGFAIMPRAKFMQTILLDAIGLCFGGAVAILGLWSAVQARHHTTPPGQSPAGYNSSASAVCAIWLFFNIFLVNTIRSAYPQFNFPTIIYAIFANVAFVYGTQFVTTAQVLSFVRRLIIAFLTGFGLAAGVSFFIFPTNARKPVFTSFAGLLKNFRAMMKAQTAFMSGFTSENPFAPSAPPAPPKQTFFSRMFGKKPEPAKEPPHFLQGQSAALRGTVQGLTALYSKLIADLPFAKREVAFGKLSADDMNELYRRLREVGHPLLGLSSIVDIFERISTMQSWDSLFAEDSSQDEVITEEQVEARSRESFDEWRRIMKALSESFGRIQEVMDEAVQHVLYRFEFEAVPKTKADEESTSTSARPGEDGFAAYFQSRIDALNASKHDTLRAWCQERGVGFPAAPDAKAEEWLKTEQDVGVLPSKSERQRRELFLVLYMEYLFFAAAQALMHLVEFADGKVADGTMKKNRLLAPGWKRFHKWLRSVFASSDGSPEDIDTTGQPPAAGQIYFGEAYTATRRDPEHLPAEGFWQKLGNIIRLFPRFMRSEPASFGFRASCATMTIAIVAYLQATQQFFIKQRLIWAMIMVAFSMMKNSGHSVFNFLARIAGTAIATVASFVVWYIVDGRTPGVIVFLFIWVAICFYPVLTMPKYIIVAILSCVTVILIVGYELQVDKIGVTLSETNGQPAYAIYLLAPYRLAAVAGGLFVAYIWTIFPYPMTEQHELRRTTGAALFAAASYYSMVHEMFLTRLHCTPKYLGSKDDKGSPAAKLDKARIQFFSKSQVYVAQLRETEAFTKFDLTLGGRFPQAKYTALTNKIERIINCTSMIAYASRTFLEHENLSPESLVWQRDFRRLIKSVGPTSRDITSRLTILSSSLVTGQPLPPYIRKLQNLQLVQRLAQIDTDVLSMRHLEEPGYSAFACCQIAARTITTDLNEATELVRELVGELDFSFNVIEAEARGPDESSSDEESSPSSRDGKEKFQ